MWSFLSYLNNIWDSYPIEFIAFIFTGLFTIYKLINFFLPDNKKINKRYLFFKKVSRTDSSIKISLNCNDDFDFKELKKAIANRILKNFKVLSESGGVLSLQSLNTGDVYSFKIIESDTEGRKTVLLENINSFKIGKFGKLKSLDKSLNELQFLINFFSEKKYETEKVISYVNFIYSMADRKNYQLQIRGTKDNYSFILDNKMLKITLTGLPNLESSLKESFRIWMKYFI